MSLLYSDYIAAVAAGIPRRGELGGDFDGPCEATHIGCGLEDDSQHSEYLNKLFCLKLEKGGNFASLEERKARDP